MGLKGFLYKSAPGYNAVLNLEEDMNQRYSTEVEAYWPEEKQGDPGSILQAQRAAALQRAYAFRQDTMYAAQSQLAQQSATMDEVEALKRQCLTLRTDLAYVRQELTAERAKPKMQVKVEAAEDVTLRLRKELDAERQKNMKLADQLGLKDREIEGFAVSTNVRHREWLDLESENRGLRAKVQQLKDQIIKLGARPY